MIQQRPLHAGDRPLIADLLGKLDAFTEDERAVALELVDHRLGDPASDDYRFILSLSVDEGAERLAGYLCYGRTPMTQSTYDLYWLGTSPDFARMGVARGLVASLEGELAREGGGLIRVETGSREGHGAAVHFYDAVGFARTATIVDFYAPGDDLIIFTKRVPAEGAVDAPGLDEAALLDAALGYRDYAADRDFLLGCARRFGGREVRRVLAWASGAGRHLRAFADAGVGGVGVEASEAMVAYAQRVAGSRHELRFLRGPLDERPAGVEPVDLSFVLVSSIHHLASAPAIERHLAAAASLLRPGGLHVIEATHPGDLLPTGVHHTEWTEVRGASHVDARFRIHLDRLGPDRVVPVTLEVARTAKKGGAPPARLRQEDRWLIPDLDGWRALVARVPELAVAAVLGDFNVTVPYEHQAAWRLILVLRKS